MIYYISLYIVRFLSWLYAPATVRGKENIPKKGGCILACNHLSNLDPFIMGTTTNRFLNFMAKEEMFRNKLASFYWHQVGAFPIKRDTSDFFAIREALRRLKKGRLLVLFPEGTRGTSQRAKKINPGVGLLVKKAGVPVIPVFLKDTDKALPNDAKWFKRHPVTITLGEPIHFSERQPNNEIASSIMEHIYRLVELT